MGQRANILVIEGGARQLWYSHWAANTLPQDLFPGPGHALRFARRQEPTSEWLDEVWCEGGAVIDVDRRVLLLFGGEDLLYDPALRSTYLELLAETWTGYTLQWAHEGIAAMAVYAGLSRAAVLAKEAPTWKGAPPVPNDHWPRTAVSATFPDGTTTAWATEAPSDMLMLFGDKLCDALATWPRPAQPRRFLLGDDCNGGVHVDARRHVVGFWCASPCEDAVARARAHWPGWAVEWWRDEHHVHEHLSRPALAFDVESEHRRLERVLRMLRPRVQHRGVAFAKVTDLLRGQGRRVDGINAHANIDERPDIDQLDLDAIIDMAVTAWRTRSPGRRVVDGS
jgi:hypothetical protein